MSRDELIGAIREQISRAVANALTSGTPSIGMLNRCQEAILDAIDQWHGDNCDPR